MVLFSILATASTSVDPRAFIQSVNGTYKIERFGGEVPNKEYVAEVSDLDLEGFLAMPYCPKGSPCDPGYISLPYSQTKVTKEDKSTSVLYTIQSTESGKVSTYTWEAFSDGHILFKNFQYSFNNGVVGILEHVLRKNP